MKNRENVEDRDHKSSAGGAEYVLRLFITGASQNSSRAVVNIKKVCETYLKGKYSLEIIDVYQQREIARAEQIIALPLLIKIKPTPERRLIGDMSDLERVLSGLGIIQEK